MGPQLLQAPLEFSNPINGADSMPNGRTVFTPKRGDFVLFPSYLPHTVPMRHASPHAWPRISIAFNIWFTGSGLNRCVLHNLWSVRASHLCWALERRRQGWQ